jgi:hypothetical protein
MLRFVLSSLLDLAMAISAYFGKKQNDHTFMVDHEERL